MSAPVVSVLMPAYNAATTLDAALESLRLQTLDDFEIVLVDDGSGDGTGELIRAWQARDVRVRPVAQPHQGLIAALNRGLQACRGDLVARMDADDLAHPERLERQVSLLDDEPEVSVAGSLVEIFPREDLREGFRLYEEWLNQLVRHEEIVREIFIESPIAHSSAVLRRRELVDLGGYEDRGWPEDYDLWLRYFAAGRRFAKVPVKLLRWREHPQRATHTDSRYSVENFLRAKAFYLCQGVLRGRDAVLVWGAGKTGRRLSKHLIRGGCTPRAFIDIDPARIGTTRRGIPIVAPAELPALWGQSERPALLSAVASRGARGLIRQQLTELGLVEGRDYWCAA